MVPYKRSRNGNHWVLKTDTDPKEFGNEELH